MEVKELSNAMLSFGVTTEEASKAIGHYISLLPPFTKEDIERIKANPSLSTVAKIRIIRNMKKQMKGNRNG